MPVTPMEPRRIRAVFFDLDGTLLDHRGAADSAVVRLPERSGGCGKVRREAVVRLWRQLEDEHMRRYLAGEVSFAAHRRARIQGLFRHLGYRLSPGQADEAFAFYLAHYESSWRSFPDVPVSLEALEGLETVGVITNGDPDQQSNKLEALGLASRLDPVVSSGEVGASKPNPVIFHEACARASQEPASCAYVGDSLDTDALAAREAGMLGIWLDRDRSTDDSTQGSRGGVSIIHTLTQLAARLP